jgi:hypothetical protein
MGFAPDQIDRWEPYQIKAVYIGWVKANTPKTVQPPSDDDFRAAIARTVS